MGQFQSNLTEEHLDSWNDSDVKKWKKAAAQTQKMFYMSFEGRQWDEYESDEYDLLRAKICYALYGPPQNHRNENGARLNRIEEAYSDDQRTLAHQIKLKMLEVHEESNRSSLNLRVGFIFVMCKKQASEFSIPLFRVCVNKNTANKQSKYIDSVCRVYSSWNDWKESNDLPMLKYCYPKYGYYSSASDSYCYEPESDPIIGYGTSPACDFLSRMGREADILCKLGSLASAGVGITAMFIPIAGPFLAAATLVGTSSAVYGGVRSVDRLIDKGTHSESLSDIESVLSVLSIIAIPAHFATASANAAIQAGARSGRTFTTMIRTGATILNFTRITLDSTILVMGLINLVDKYDKGQLTKLEILQFSISTFFFSNTLIQPKTAKGIIKLTQKKHFDDYQMNLRDAEAEEAFKNFVKENNDNIYKSSHVVRTINKIENPSAFFKSVRRHNSHIGLGGRKGKTVTINYCRCNPNRIVY